MEKKYKDLVNEAVKDERNLYNIEDIKDDILNDLIYIEDNIDYIIRTFDSVSDDILVVSMLKDFQQQYEKIKTKLENSINETYTIKVLIKSIITFYTSNINIIDTYLYPVLKNAKLEILRNNYTLYNLQIESTINNILDIIGFRDDIQNKVDEKYINDILILPKKLTCTIGSETLRFDIDMVSRTNISYIEDKKYKLIKNDIKTINNTTLYRIKAIKDFGEIKKDDLGGYIAKEDNLSQKGDCWIHGNSVVYGNASISDNAQIYDNSIISGHSIIKENSTIDASIIYGSSYISNMNIRYSYLKHCKAIIDNGYSTIENKCFIGKEYKILDILHIDHITTTYFGTDYTLYKLDGLVYACAYKKSFICVTLKSLFDKLFKLNYSIDIIKHNANILSKILKYFDIPLNMGCNNKYELLLDDIIEFNSKALFRIRYLKDYPDISNRIGGYVSNYTILAFDNNSIIDDKSIVVEGKIYDGNIINSIVIKSNIFTTVMNSYVVNSNIYNTVLNCKINKATLLHTFKIFKDLTVSNYVGTKFINHKINEIEYTFYMKSSGYIVGCFYDGMIFKEVRITGMRNSARKNNKALAIVLDAIIEKLK